MEGYNSSIESTRDREFPGLSGLTYLDHAGATIYARSQLALVQQDLLNNLYGNPHSPCASSRLSTDTIEQVRYRILQHFNTSPEHHSVIFTAGCTAALKLLAENFDWECENSRSEQDAATKETRNLKNPQLHSEAEVKQRDSISSGESQNVMQTNGPRHASQPDHFRRASQQDPSQHAVQDPSQHAVQDPSQHAVQPDPSEHAVPARAGCFCYLMDNHTSVVGMREIARAKGADVFCVTYEEIKNNIQILLKMKSENLSLSNDDEEGNTQVSGGRRNCLFAYPAQSNFSGAKYPLNLVNTVKNLSSDVRGADHWAVVLDAASLVSTSSLDLPECEADFIAVSFYKMFGFPTGLGALIVRNDAAQLLRKTYFGGGTVQAYLARGQFSVPKANLSDWFEDGTLPFLDIIALKHGFDAMERLAGSMDSISDHTFSLARYVHHKLASYRHANGQPVAVLYCDNEFESKDHQGPIINFLLLRSSGEFVGYAQTERLASLHGIHLRTGCFCNTGACQRHLGLRDEQILANFQAGHVCGDEMDLISGQPTGSVRISFGYMSTLADADSFLSFIQDCFIEKATESASVPGVERVDRPLPPEKAEGQKPRKTEGSERADCPLKLPVSVPEDANLSPLHDTVSQEPIHDNSVLPPDATPTTRASDGKTFPPGGKVLTNIRLYPVKSCGAFEVDQWEIGAKGLLYDRHWMVVNENGVCLSQKREERLCLIRPSVDLKHGCLWLQCQGCSPISVPLDVSSETSRDQASKNCIQSKVCLDRVKVLDCGDAVANWLSAALGRQCRLLQQNPEFERNCRLAKGTSDSSSSSSSSQQQSLSLVNESPFTLLCRPSARSLLKAIKDRNHGCAGPVRGPPAENGPDQSEPSTVQFSQGEAGSEMYLEELIGRFRGNLVIDGWEAFEEDDWKKIQIGNHTFTVAGVCIRCQMVCVDQKTAVRSKEPLLTLSSFRGKKVPFGIHLLRDEASSKGTTIHVGDSVSILQQ